MLGGCSTPAKRQYNAVTVSDICNRFLFWKQSLVESSELTQRSWDDYYGACKLLAEHLGRDSVVDELEPVDFLNLRGKLAKGHSPVWLKNIMTVVNSVFSYAYEERLIERIPRRGKHWSKPSKKVIKKASKQCRPHVRDLKAHEIRAMLDHAGPNMRAMILLGIQAGFGNSDLALMPKTIVNQIDDGWLEYAREKTGVERKVPLWPERPPLLRRRGTVPSCR